MRLAPLVVLPALVAAQEQFPFADQLQGWFEKAKSLLPAAPVAPTDVPVAAVPPKAAAVVPQKTVTPVTVNNWQSLLGPIPADSAESSQEWLIYVTGGNKTCFGQCAKPDQAWKEAIPLFAADTTSPSLGKLDCESQNALCSIWSTGPPTLWHIQVPKLEEDQAKPPTPVHAVRLNATTVTAETIYKVHAEKTWEKARVIEGAFHPWDGMLAQYNLNVPVGYLIYGIGMVPSWLMMLGISFISRTFMSRRVNPQQQRPAAAQPGAGAGAAQ